MINNNRKTKVKSSVLLTQAFSFLFFFLLRWLHSAVGVVITSSANIKEPYTALYPSVVVDVISYRFLHFHFHEKHSEGVESLPPARDEKRGDLRSDERALAGFAFIIIIIIIIPIPGNEARQGKGIVFLLTAFLLS